MNGLVFRVLICSLAIVLLTSHVRCQDAAIPAIFARDNLVAWCIVPFDGKKRGPAERAKMIADLGLHRVAYDCARRKCAIF